MDIGLKHGRELLRTILGAVLLYVLLVQAITLPFARAQAADLALSGKGLALCIPSQVQDEADRKDGKPQPSHGLDCCLPGRWLDLDGPVATLTDPPVHVVIREPVRLADALVLFVRGPPSLHFAPQQARAPPLSL